MKEQRIVVEIGHDGSVAADADGFTGDTCIRELEKLLAGLAAPTTTVQRKPEGRTPGTRVRGQDDIMARRKP